MENINNDYNSTFFQDNPLENLNLAFDIAEKYLDIPRMLDPEGNITLLSLSVQLHFRSNKDLLCQS